jgi:hypothetical protein
MKKYEEIQHYSAGQFKRLVGVKKDTFALMVEILIQAASTRYRQAGRKSSLTMENRLLMALEYLREYRTYFHLGSSYGLSESACYRSCKWIEDVLIKSGKFSLPGKKALLKSEVSYEVILVDTTETPIQRPKKK